MDTEIEQSFKMEPTFKMEQTFKMEPTAPESVSSIASTSNMSAPASAATPATSGKASSPEIDSVSGNPTAGQTNASRRPPRKSTLTQQQKNQKRQRATQDQLTTLEVEFNKNPTPTAQVRERIAEDINMTERSVQIWFQNRRAKIKLMAKKSLETGEDIDAIPESMRAYLAMQAMETGKGLGGAYIGRAGLLPFGHNNMLFGGDQSGNGKVLIHHLTCRSLSIGRWMRVGQNTMDLIIFYSPDKCTMTYYINNEQAGYKIEYPFSYIKNIYLENAEGDPASGGGIVIELNHAPHFFMDTSSSGFFDCADFTEDLQASHCFVHHLGGNPKVLSGQLAKLVSMESFMNRHNQQFADYHAAMSISAPVSPAARPASQPNFIQPHQVGAFQEQWGLTQMHSATMRPPQGHKRQRSRSVPGPVDFAMFQNHPMPSFYVQPPGDMGPPAPPTPHVYAPVPQQPAGVANSLRIDTQAGFGLDMRQYPMSAAGTPVSEFPQSPGMFPPQTQEATQMPPPQFNAAFNTGFLSPMVSGDGNMPSVSPMPFTNPGEPSIVEQSPPMSMLGRPGSADMYNGNEGSCAVSEDGTSLNDMYSKHTINLPMHQHSPGFSQQQQAELDMDQLVQFDTVDPASLSPEAMPHVHH